MLTSGLGNGASLRLEMSSAVVTFDIGDVTMNRSGR